MTSKHILVVEDERHLAIGIKFNLEAEGYRVTTVGDGPSALNLLEKNDSDIDLVILDLMLPGMSGYTVCESLRSAGCDVPVLMLTARTLPEDRTRGFDVGTNQYLAKPFDLEELLSRVRNLLTHHHRRHQLPRSMPKELTTFSFGPFHLDFSKFECTHDSKALQLTKREWELLQYFIENQGRLIPRQELLENVWQMPGHIHTRAPDQFILRLRKIFEADPTNPKYLLTIRDLGYRFVPNPDGASEGTTTSQSTGSE